MDEGEGFAVEVFPILCQPAAAVEPCDGALDDPAFGQHEEALGLIGAFDDLDLELGQRLLRRSLEQRTLIAAIGVELAQKRIEAEQRCHQQRTAIAVLDIGGVDDGMHQEPQCIDENVPLLALDLLARIVARRVRDPPFSALFTLWLSMIAAVGLASRSTCSRQRT